MGLDVAAYIAKLAGRLASIEPGDIAVGVDAEDLRIDTTISSADAAAIAAAAAQIDATSAAEFGEWVGLDISRKTAVTVSMVATVETAATV